jgi:hypothetical protein
MTPTPTTRASTYPSVPVGIAFDVPLSALTREEYEALFGDEHDTQPAALEVLQ